MAKNPYSDTRGFDWLLDWLFYFPQKLRRCPHCHVRLGDRVRGPFHSGFSSAAWLYCSGCGRSLCFGTYDPNFARLFPGKCAHALEPDEQRVIELAVIPCPCGGVFKFDAPPRCPECRGSLVDFGQTLGMRLRVDPEFSAEDGDNVWR